MEDELILDLISHSGAPRLKFQTSTSLNITPGDMESAAMSSNQEAGLAAESQCQVSSGHIMAGLGRKVP